MWCHFSQTIYCNVVFLYLFISEARRLAHEFECLFAQYIDIFKGLINLETSVLVRSLKSNNVEFGLQCTWMRDRSMCVVVWVLLIWLFSLSMCWLWVDTVLAIGQFRLWVHGTCGLNNLWNWTCRKCQAVLEIPVDLPGDSSWVSRMKQKHWDFKNVELYERYVTCLGTNLKTYEYTR